MPTVTIVADAFLSLFVQASSSLGMAKLPRAVTGYPAAPDAGDAAAIGRRVEVMMADIVNGLTAGPP